MSHTVRFEEVTKRYPRGGPRYASLRYDVAEGFRRFGMRLRRKRPEPRGTLALDNLSFEVGEGESFAIVGPNGAGKTTALKLVTRISYPSAGRVRVRGRVGALIEIGSGVHPELTGRENIWLYGQILGMSKAEVRRNFDEIVEFAELSHALDTPVKMFSSGMQLRLGFAIASYLSPEIFVVDEALAVGDAGFQAKCVERMTNLVAEGRTILFVSHNLYAVEALCPRGMYLNKGRIVCEGPISQVLSRYAADVDQRRLDNPPAAVDGYVRGGPLAVSLRCRGPNGKASLRTGESLTLECRYLCDEPGLEALFHFGVSDSGLGNLFLASQVVEGEPAVTLGPSGLATFTIPRLPLQPRVYEVWGEVRLGKGWGNIIDWQPLARFRVEAPPERLISVSHGTQEGPLKVDVDFAHRAEDGPDAGLNGRRRFESSEAAPAIPGHAMHRHA
jgi:ABC-type polysaccharide/polyol phosphate transport system ATPase subunit